MANESYRVVDMHTAGEPVRIIVEGYPRLEGRTILEKRRDAKTRFDDIRTRLMLEPRGHAGMYGVIPTEASHPDAAFGVLFTHNSGYSTMCGHATIALGRWAIESGCVRSSSEITRFVIEAPCGLVRLESHVRDGRVERSFFESVPSFASHFDTRVEVPGFGEIVTDIAYGGAFYAILPSSRIGLPFWDSPLEQLVDAGTRITAAARKTIEVRHPQEPDLSFLYGTILTDDADPQKAEPTYNVCVFAEGQIDRSPTGSGATARMALDFARGRIRHGQVREFRGVTGVGFSAEVISTEGSGLDARSVIRVGGTSHFTGESTLIIEADDALRDGFSLPANFASVRR